MIRCINHPDAKNKTFLVSDGDDLSTPDLLNLIASAMDRSIHLFPFPIFLLKMFGILMKKSNEIEKLIGSLQINNEYGKEKLDWSPPISVREGIKRMVQEK